VGFSNLVGVDPHIEGTTRYNGIVIEKSTIAEVQGVFDLVTLHHSLEHMPDQAEVFRSIRSHLCEGGHCLIRIPLVTSALWEIYGVDWVELDAPRHLYLHSFESMKQLASEAGLRLVELTWDSTEFDFAGSEQYRRGIPLTAAKSFLKQDNQSDFTLCEMANFARMAKEVNAAGRGGRGCFLFSTN
jgi:SAM-dependent methyltransferase